MLENQVSNLFIVISMQVKVQSPLIKLPGTVLFIFIGLKSEKCLCVLR